MESTDYNLPALKTLGGAIHYTLTRYGQTTINQSTRDWESLASALHVAKGAPASIELKDLGFVLQVECVSMVYHHSDFHSERIVEVQNSFKVPQAVS